MKKTQKVIMVTLIIIVVIIAIVCIWGYPIIKYTIHLDETKASLAEDAYVEVSYINDDGHIRIPCQINGDSVNLAVDTKAVNLMRAEMIEHHGGVYWGKLPFKGANAHGEKSKIALYAFESVKIGDQEIKKPLFQKIKEESAIYDILGDGVLGSTMLSVGTWKFDNEKNKVKLFHSENKAILEKETEGFAKISNGLRNDGINLSLDKILKNQPFTFDLGYSGGVQITNEIRQELIGRNYPYYKIKRIVGDFNMQDSMYILKRTTVNIDTFKIENCELVNISSINMNLIGANFIKNFNFVLMYGNYIKHTPQEHLYLKRIAKGVKQEPSRRISKFGISISKYTSKVFISRLLEAGTAEKNGLELGEEVVAVNHNDFDIVSPDKIKESAFNAYTEALDTLYIKTTKGEYVLVEDEELKEK